MLPLLLFFLLLINACTSGGKYPIGHDFTPAENKDVAKVGKPYKVKGEWYYPQIDLQYSETGIASWYGEDFHRKGTANGETFDKYAMTAAHRTLPMPSMVRVTNLANGNSVVLRVNDRGPFSSGRIIDVSRHAAEKLGFIGQGTAKVRVDYLPEETALLFPAGENPYESGKSNIAGKGFITEANASEVEQAVLPPQKLQEENLKAQLEAADNPYAKIPATPKNMPFKTGKSFAEGNSGNDKAAKKSYYIQVGSYKLESKAIDAAKQLKGVANPEVIAAKFNGTKFYRIRLGPLLTSKMADQKLDMVVNYGFKDAFVVSN